MLPKMNWFLFPVLCCLFMLLSGCDEFKNPLSDPNSNETDQSLVGVWTVSTEGDKLQQQVNASLSPDWTMSMGVGEKVTCTVSMPSSNENLPKGVMKCELHNSTGKARYFLLIPTKIGDDHFLSVPQRDNDTEAITTWKPDEAKRYSLFKYKVSGHKIKFYYRNERMTDARIYRAIKNGDLRGRVIGNMLKPGGMITEPTDALRKYVEDNEAWLFTEKVEATK